MTRSNAVFDASEGHIVLVAMCKIHALDDILVGYGSGYWANMRKCDTHP